ncbi:MAG: alpha/beta hydrolase, partial [Stenotrophomonas sp.]
GPQDYPALAQWVLPQLPRAPFVLLAESFSGPLAIELAARQPPALHGLVLAATFARRPVPLPAASAAMLSPAWPMPPLALLARLLLGRWHDHEHRLLLRDALAQVPTGTLRQRAAATLRVDVRSVLSRIAVPTLCLQARQGRLLWPPSVSELLALLPDARHVALEGPHLLLQARAEPAAAVVAGWVKALPPVD